MGYPARRGYLDPDKARQFAAGRNRGARAQAREAAERACVERALADAGFAPAREALILDMPCGAGRYLDQFSTGARRVLGADISPAMVQAALAASPGTDAFVAEGEHLPLADCSVAVAATMRMLHHLPSAEARVRWLAELRRVCDGALIGTFIQARSPHHVTRRIKRLLGGADPHRYAQTTTELRDELSAAGWRLAGVYPTRGWWSENWVFRAEPASP
jgi:hypothetical protein